MAFPFVLTGQPRASLEDYLRAIEDLVNIVGIDQVGLGPDFMEEMPRHVQSQALAGFDDDTAAHSFPFARRPRGSARSPKPPT